MQWNQTGNSVSNKWGTSPTLLEPMKVTIIFHTSADTLILYPLDTLGRRVLTPIGATKNSKGYWRATIDQSVSKSPWFFVEQRFADTSTTGIQSPLSTAFSLSPNYPEPFTS